MNSQYISTEGLEELRKELNDLKTKKRIEIADRLKIAKDYGDLSENSEYTEAREDQAKIEARILELEDLMKNAVTLRADDCGDAVHVGCTVVVKKNGATKNFCIVGTYEAKPEEGKISDESPLGKAFMKKKVGEKVIVTTPAGPITYEILKIE
jgi:transcription elongation factor GreA